MLIITALMRWSKRLLAPSPFQRVFKYHVEWVASVTWHVLSERTLNNINYKRHLLMKGRKGRERETGEKEGEISGMERSGIPAEQKKRRTSITS